MINSSGIRGASFTQTNWPVFGPHNYIKNFRDLVQFLDSFPRSLWCRDWANTRFRTIEKFDPNPVRNLAPRPPVGLNHQPQKRFINGKCQCISILLNTSDNKLLFSWRNTSSFIHRCSARSQIKSLKTGITGQFWWTGPGLPGSFRLKGRTGPGLLWTSPTSVRNRSSQISTCLQVSYLWYPFFYISCFQKLPGSHSPPN